MATQHHGTANSTGVSSAFIASPSHIKNEAQLASASPQAQHPHDQQAAHSRAYQACLPCRNRKVKCDLGDPDDPRPPPCARCRREHKDCHFSSQRRKKKTATPNADGGGDDQVKEEDDSPQHGRKRIRTANDDDVDDLDVPRTPGGSIARREPLRRPTSQRAVKHTEEDHKTSDQAAAFLQGAEIHGGHDAVNTLSQVAKMTRKAGPGLQTSTTTPPMLRTGSSNLAAGDMSALPGDSTHARHASHSSGPSATAGTPSQSSSYQAALRVWSRFRFVRHGWFTNVEAINYVDYFYKNLAPLTPVALPDFSSYDTHETLLTREPMLTITILLIASRHANLKGPGSVSRPYEIHRRLWNYLQGMINRVQWGQEQPCAGVNGAGLPASDVNPLSRRGLRTLGTIESLVLLTEWHPRMMHFPPDEADGELILPAEGTASLGDHDDDDDPNGIGGQRMDAWLEPVWRSDRMSWMLLGMAMSLAIEIGVFDKTDWTRLAKNANWADGSTAEDLKRYDARQASVRDVLLVYVTQTSGRLGLTTMLPANYSKPEHSELFKRGLGQHANTHETVMHFWLRMATIIREGNARIFANKEFTRDLIKNGDYKTAIDGMQEPLNSWLREFRACTSVPKYMRSILLIEYNYTKVYVNALALQAVAERCANEQPTTKMFDTPVQTNKSINPNGANIDQAIPPQTLAKWLGGDRKYLLAVGDAARNLLKIVVDELYPGGYLRHAPVRTYFRIISTAMMLLKSFSLGATESDTADSLALLDGTVKALKLCIVDDVHVASRFAELLETLSDSLKPRLVRISADGRGSRSGRMSQRDTPAPIATLADLSVVRPHASLQQQPQAVASAMTAREPVNYNAGHSNGFMPTTTGPYAGPMFGISNDSYNMSDNDMSVMPPPYYFSPTQMNMTTHYDPVHGTNTFGMPSQQLHEDWFALPLDGLIGAGLNNHSDQDAIVNQTMTGPVIDGQDMLGMLLGYGGNGSQNGYN